MTDLSLSLEQFSFEYPSELVAQEPAKPRGSSRLMALRSDGIDELSRFSDLDKYLRPGDVLVLNQTKVLKARVRAQRPTGGKVELLFERPVESQGHVDTLRWLALARPAKSLKEGNQLLCGDFRLEVGPRHGMFVEIGLPVEPEDFFPNVGRLPLPPYITRDTSVADDEDYQPIFAAEPGAVAAPTASLHFTQEHLNRLIDSGIITTSLVLHVGAGTFLPVRREHADDIREHEMHRERYELPLETVETIEKAKREGRRVIAVGTTAVRALESYGQSGERRGDTSLFIYPGYKFKFVDALITNFHQPKTTLLMMVSAFAGRDRILSAYHRAIEEKYRLFSYGDAMFVEHSLKAD